MLRLTAFARSQLRPRPPTDTVQSLPRSHAGWTIVSSHVLVLSGKPRPTVGSPCEQDLRRNLSSTICRSRNTARSNAAGAGRGGGNDSDRPPYLPRGKAGGREGLSSIYSRESAYGRSETISRSYDRSAGGYGSSSGSGSSSASYSSGWSARSSPSGPPYSSTRSSRPYPSRLDSRSSKILPTTVKRPKSISLTNTRPPTRKETIELLLDRIRIAWAGEAPSRGASSSREVEIRAPPAGSVIINANDRRKMRERVELYLHGSGGDVVKGWMKAFEGEAVAELEIMDRAPREGSHLDPGLKLDPWELLEVARNIRYDEDWQKTLDRAVLRRFLSWVVEMHDEEKAPGRTNPVSLSSTIVSRLASLLATTDLTSLPRSYTSTREIHRHFHLHIGPTNSGKTYAALKSLALAETGSYAGPLRLLAHEVWERLNRGTVAGLEEGKGRECNLITGEERRVVSPDAGLTSCTVEMLSSSVHQKVVVIDEIQMIGDGQRGSSWTNAIMGVRADEVHLCGEETVVGVMERMVASMGDRLTVHRYERLTPLKISTASLEGDIGNVTRGDCVVAFSRSGIFAMKKSIEQTTGLRCAVVYGALPPETRAEQAKLFNDEASGVDVMVASDAVGMGLNLKIKRMIFEALHKWNGKAEVPLSISQVKQIAGRAGRYGQHSTGAVGEVTTFNPEDLPLLKRIMPSALPPVPRAVMEAPFESLAELSLLLPSDTPFSALLAEFGELARVPDYCVYKDMAPSVMLAESLNGFADVLSLKEMSVFAQAPINVRDDKVVGAFQAYLHAYAHDGEVSVRESLESSRLIPTLEMVELAREALRSNPVPGAQQVRTGQTKSIPPEVVAAIPMLESLHKALVLYIWLSFRFDLAFTQRVEAETIKLRVEDSLEECLERLPGVRPGKRGGNNNRRAPAPELHQRKEETKESKINWMSRDAYKRMDLDRRFGGQDLLPPPCSSSSRKRDEHRWTGLRG